MRPPSASAVSCSTSSGAGTVRAVDHQCEASWTDVWGNTRLTGVGRPPFPVELLDGVEKP